MALSLGVMSVQHPPELKHFDDDDPGLFNISIFLWPKIHHFRVVHNKPCCASNIFHNNCFHLLLGIQVIRDKKI